MKQTLLLIFCLLATSYACASAPPPTAQEQELRNIFVLKKINDTDASEMQWQSGKPTLEIYPSKKQFAGKSGANIIRGNIKLDDKKNISLSILISTRTMDTHGTESIYLKALASVTRYERKKDLILYDHNKIILVFKKVD